MLLAAGWLLCTCTPACLTQQHVVCCDHWLCLTEHEHTAMQQCCSPGRHHWSPWSESHQPELILQECPSVLVDAHKSAEIWQTDQPHPAGLGAHCLHRPGSLQLVRLSIHRLKLPSLQLVHDCGIWNICKWGMVTSLTPTWPAVGAAVSQLKARLTAAHSTTHLASARARAGAS